MDGQEQCIIFHHGGKWLSTVGWTYVDEKLEIFSDIPTNLTPHDLKTLVRALGTVFGGGLEYRKGFWRIAKSTTENDFTENISKFTKISVVTGQDLMKRNYRKWVRAFQTPQSLCDNIDNNMNEVFNGYILSSRHKPIITMLEDIREGLMERMHKKRDFIANKQIYLCPRIQQKLEKSKMWARGWLAFWDGHFSYGVREGATKVRFVVSLLGRTCSCNAWQLSGIPCNHAVAAIWKVNELPGHYVSDCYKKRMYLKAYEFPLELLNGPQRWPESQYDHIQAPTVKRMNHRPKVKRRPSVGEVDATRLPKKGITQKCGNCGGEGHNRRKCSNPPKVVQSQATSSSQAQPKQKQPKQKSVQNPPMQYPQTNLPMHNRGVGIYNYPSGYIREAVFENQNTIHPPSNMSSQNFNI